eukprot:CAMPEP_0194195960 /NCGR_PEP_ID=MMETSP0154-20130528/76411_1 /TAXON_ID=1049557 /ORGANISM="Thalassiothrix antarctica, Strain L6-D1" /LENGTH=459 /DNA_ID=CAMNT_0038920523 /DNA_START=132 /DNA_END=1511 /DNA_ORIENTATION=-
MLILNTRIGSLENIYENQVSSSSSVLFSSTSEKSNIRKPNAVAATSRLDLEGSSISTNNNKDQQLASSILDGKRILAVIASFDFSQIPHLEELLDSFHDMCVAGAQIDVFIHTTVPYPVSLIDLLNTRHDCTNTSPRSGFSITITLLSPKLRLHLVDKHRSLFYEKIDDYDIFVYTEDDIRITPRTIAAYLYETDRVQSIVGQEHASDYNVGVVRYEYNYPPDIIIDDKTRAATANVTRVYWEHSWHPVIPKAVDAVPQKPLSDKYVHMTNHHQGMYIATQFLLKAWKERPGCEFDIVKNRPGMKNRPSQPSEGTQRVWMSSQHLHGKRHCNVQQVIPIDKFGELTVHHLPNKNYRRVGRHGRLGGGQGGTEAQHVFGNETFTQSSSQLVSAIQLHVEFAKRWPKTPQIPYQGPVFMENEGCDQPFERVKSMVNDYFAYIHRGGVMSEEDMTKLNWLDE